MVRVAGFNTQVPEGTEETGKRKRLYSVTGEFIQPFLPRSVIVAYYHNGGIITGFQVEGLRLYPPNLRLRTPVPQASTLVNPFPTVRGSY